MSEQRFLPPDTDGIELLRGISGMENADLTVTHARYNLSTRPEVADVTRLTDDDPTQRFLVVPTGKDQEGLIEAQLEEARISAPRVLGVADGHLIYEVRVGAKPLNQERLFPGRASTETYISDEELSRELGKLWGRVYKYTGRLPHDSPYKNTGIEPFTGKRATLFPIPPYDWESFEGVTSGRDHFLDSVHEELLQPGSAAGDYERLLAAAEEGWREE